MPVDNCNERNLPGGVQGTATYREHKTYGHQSLQACARCVLDFRLLTGRKFSHVMLSLVTAARVALLLFFLQELSIGPRDLMLCGLRSSEPHDSNLALYAILLSLPHGPASCGCVAHLASAASKANLRTPRLRARGADALSPGRPHAHGAPNPEPAQSGRRVGLGLGPASPARIPIGRHLGGRAVRSPHLPSPLHGQIGGCGTPAPRSRSTRGQA